MEKVYNELFMSETEVLGVICRGSDYTNKRPKGHQIQPNPRVVLKEAKRLIASSKYKKIYLATEDANIYEMFKKEFRDKLIENVQYKYSYTSQKLKFTEKITFTIWGRNICVQCIYCQDVKL